MSLLVGPSGAPVYANPMEGEIQEAHERMRRQLAAALYGGGIPGYILDQYGRPANPKPIKRRRGFDAWGVRQ